MRHLMSFKFVLAALLAPIAGAAAQETNRAPIQTRRAAPSEENDRQAQPPPAHQSPRDRDLLPPLSPPTLPSPVFQPALPPLPLATPPMGFPVPPVWQPTPPIHAPQPMMPPGPGPQQPGRSTIVDRELSVLDVDAGPTSLSALRQSACRHRRLP